MATLASKTVATYVPKNGGTVTTSINVIEVTPTDLINACSTRATQAGWDTQKAVAINSVLVKGFGKIAEAKVNLAVAYAEASKTSDLILDTARRIDRAYRAFRKGNLKVVARELNITPKRLHKSWLEYKYGWMPLLMDVKGAAEFFAQQHVVRPPRFKVTAREEFTKNSDFSSNLQGYGGLPGDWHITTLGSYNMKATVKFHCELTNPHLAELQQLGLTNPLLVAWELVPFSFVFDWFIHVGDYLTGLTALNGVTIRHQMLSVEDSRGWTQYGPPTVRVDSTYRYNHSGWNWAASDRRYTRSNNFAAPWGLYPPVTNSFNFPKLVTSLALLRGSYRGNARL